MEEKALERTREQSNLPETSVHQVYRSSSVERKLHCDWKGTCTFQREKLDSRFQREKENGAKQNAICIKKCMT